MKRTLMTYAALMACGLGLLAAGCGGLGKTAARSTFDDGNAVDPFAYGDEFANETRGSSIPQSPVESRDAGSVPRDSAPAQSQTPAQTGRPAPQDPSPAPAVTYGYRVQIGIDEDKDTMERLAERARKKLQLPVYLEFEAPFYRVRVGDFVTKEEAERHVRLLKENGYDSSRRVFSRINTR